MANYYYARDGQRNGPVTPDRIKQLAAQGQLRPDDLLWMKGWAAWRKAGGVQGLFVTPAKPAPLPPPPLPAAAVAQSPQQTPPSADPLDFLKQSQVQPRTISRPTEVVGPPRTIGGWWKSRPKWLKVVMVIGALCILGAIVDPYPGASDVTAQKMARVSLSLNDLLETSERMDGRFSVAVLDIVNSVQAGTPWGVAAGRLRHAG